MVGLILVEVALASVAKARALVAAGLVLVSMGPVSAALALALAATPAEPSVGNRRDGDAFAGFDAKSFRSQTARDLNTTGRYYFGRKNVTNFAERCGILRLNFSFIEFCQSPLP